MGGFFYRLFLDHDSSCMNLFQP